MQQELVFDYKACMSVNSMYYTNYSHKGMKFLTRPAKLLKSRIINDTLNQMGEKKFWRSDILEMEIKFVDKF